METLRTPDARFENLPGYPFAPHYLEIPDGEGGRLRVLAPDLVGFGRSDKPTEKSDYTYPRHVACMRAWVRVLVCSSIVADGIPAVSEETNILLVFPSLVRPEKLGPEGVGLFISSWRELERWEKPFFTAYGKADPVLGFFDVVFQEYVPGAKGRKHRAFPKGTHFIQEQEPAALVEVIDEAARAA